MMCQHDRSVERAEWKLRHLADQPRRGSVRIADAGEDEA
jgi:hypothetical protein